MVEKLDMKNIFEILSSYFEITQIVIENFASLEKELKIDIKIHSIEFGNKTISCANVSSIKINPEYYTMSDKCAIIIEDISSAQMEDIRFEIRISVNAMTFYCKEISLS